MGFQLVVKSVTLNYSVMAVILRYSTEFSSFGDQLFQVVEDRPTVCDF